jgi:glycogen operon protein
VQNLTRLRRKYPILRRNLFLTGDYNDELGVKDVTWINANGSEMEGDQWGDPNMRSFGMLLDGRAQTTGIRQRGKEATLLLVFNGSAQCVRFTIPACPGGTEWSLLVDTNIVESGNRRFKTGDEFELTAHSLLLFVLEPESAA